MDREVHKDVEMLPGTEIMADIQGAHFVHAQNSANSAVLVPQPSEDPHDPLVSFSTSLAAVALSHARLVKGA